MISEKFNESDDGWCNIFGFYTFVYHDYLGWKIRVAFTFIHDKKLFKTDPWETKGTIIIWEDIERLIYDYGKDILDRNAGESQ